MRAGGWISHRRSIIIKTDEIPHADVLGSGLKRTIWNHLVNLAIQVIVDAIVRRGIGTAKYRECRCRGLIP